MAFYLAKTDLQTHIYSENIDTITRNNDVIVYKAIAAGIAEAQSYMGRYNIALIIPSFMVITPATTKAEIEVWLGAFVFPVGYVSYENLLNKVKDLAAWHLVKLANPNINLELFRTAYEDAIEWFTKVMKGQSQPYGWPMRVDDPNTDYVEGGPIQWTSNVKRENYL